ncbi:MAG: hypothetical protein IJ849_04775 [Selenomonadaceae bacterium]|nr:hypothetical protein [Selenomonadaceae bacterium]
MLTVQVATDVFTAAPPKADSNLLPEEYDRIMQELLAELEKGVRSGEEEGWVSADELQRLVDSWCESRL